MEVTVNFWSVIGAVVASMVIGAIWYSPSVFGKTWAKLGNIDEKKAADGRGKGLVGMAVYSLIMAFVLAHVAYLSYSFYKPEYSFAGAALTSAFWMWLGFIVPIQAANSLFNQAPWKLTLIQLGGWLVTLLGMAIVIGQFGY